MDPDTRRLVAFFVIATAAGIALGFVGTKVLGPLTVQTIFEVFTPYARMF